jgi:hypothetical protein
MFQWFNPKTHTENTGNQPTYLWQLICSVSPAWLSVPSGHTSLNEEVSRLELQPVSAYMGQLWGSTGWVCVCTVQLFLYINYWYWFSHCTVLTSMYLMLCTWISIHCTCWIYLHLFIYTYIYCCLIKTLKGQWIMSKNLSIYVIMLSRVRGYEWRIIAGSGLDDWIY